MRSILYVAIGLLVLGGAVFGMMSLKNNEDALQSAGVEKTEDGIPTTRDIATINLSGKGLTSVPMNTFSQTAAIALDLSNNKLSGSLPAEIRLLSNLRSLDLSDNNFTGVPAEIGQLQHLETLDLSNNPITGLPYELQNLKNLRVLDLQGTNYSEADLGVIRAGLGSDVDIRTD